MSQGARRALRALGSRRVWALLAVLAILFAQYTVIMPPERSVAANWALQPTPISTHLYDVHFPVDTSTGYAVGDAGVILKTTDGGTTWASLPSPTAADLRG